MALFFFFALYTFCVLFFGHVKINSCCVLFTILMHGELEVYNIRNYRLGFGRIRSGSAGSSKVFIYEYFRPCDSWVSDMLFRKCSIFLNFQTSEFLCYQISKASKSECSRIEKCVSGVFPISPELFRT